MGNLTNYKKIIIFWIVWRVIIQLFLVIGRHILPFVPSFAYWEVIANSGLSPLIYSWANFDGVHFLTIANIGYSSVDLIQAFFPVYPFLIRIVSNLISQPIIAGLIISNLCSIGMILFGFKLAKKWFSTKVAYHFVAVLLSFPTSFYFGAVYSESLFLLLILAGCWYCETKKQLISGLLIGLSSGVRLVGLMFFPGILVGWIKQIQKSSFSKSKQLQNILKKNQFLIIGLIAGLSIFIGYTIYLGIEFSDPFYYFTVQSKFGAGRQSSLILLPQTIYRSIKILIFARPFNWKYFSYAQDLVISLSVLAGIIFSFKKFKIEYMIFALLSFILPTLTGNLSSMARYVLVIFPVFMWWAILLSKNSKLRLFYYPLSMILLFINVILFVQGYWVA